MSQKWEGAEHALRLALARRPNLNVDGFLGKRREEEKFWVEHYDFLLSNGYQLRPRYNPEWVPSWIRAAQPTEYLDYEDSIPLLMYTHLNDALHVQDGSKVVFKHVKRLSKETVIVTSLSDIADPRNHCVPVLAVLSLPGATELDPRDALLVMPRLIHFAMLPFCFVGEFAEAMRQFVEGLQFMHECGVAHRDACHFNLMMDGSKVVPNGCHFVRPISPTGIVRDTIEWHTRWSVKPNKYYFIDFDLAASYARGVEIETQVGRIGQDRSVPEFAFPLSPFPYNPFKVDIYQLGNALLTVVERYDGLEPFLALLKPMTSQYPEDRPALSEVLSQLDDFTPEMLECRVKSHSRTSLDETCFELSEHSLIP
ncbi:hypothetical protein D9615_006620 [Tricholomella constricta]|uniref:Protein kinase domain-containing protein n=1 Tax=Tricholomella constricta TaxID=117010 RepID=A0A8H5H9X0_9AGAR|nr:hypothetical protein D9615_006620 [Tricholomella constricta]